VSPGPPDHPREELVHVGDGSLWTATQGTGLPLVLCHGGPGLCDNLGPLADLLDHRATVHRYDQRGNGRSTRSGSFDVATFVADLEALRHHWGYERWVVGGHSWGASLALFYAAAHPERTAGVVAVSATGLRWGWQAATRSHRVRRLSPEERSELALIEARLETGEAGDAERARHVRLLWSTDFVSRTRAAEVLDAGPLYACRRDDVVFRAVADDQRRILEGGFIGTARALPTPLLALHGAGDADPSRAHHLATTVPHGRLVMLPDAGHSPWLEVPDAAAAAIGTFLEDLEMAV
jgi:proline iminopeptidase